MFLLIIFNRFHFGIKIKTPQGKGSCFNISRKQDGVSKCSTFMVFMPEKVSHSNQTLSERAVLPFQLVSHTETNTHLLS